MKRIVYLLSLFTFPLTHYSQVPVPQNGVALAEMNSSVLFNAIIYVNPTQKIENGTLIIRNKKVISVGTNLSIPTDLPAYDMKGKTIVPSFIELNSSLGVQQPKREGWSYSPQIESNKKGPYYWNESIHPEIDATNLYTADQSATCELHQMGFGYAVVHQNDGIAQGTGTLIALNTRSEKDQILRSQIAAYFSLKKGASRQDYPSSQMGCIALLRQALYDAQWHAKNGTTPNYSLEAMNKQATLPAFFATSEKYELLRVHRIGREFNRKFTILGTGHEYTLGKIWDTLPHQFLIPINFPAAYDVKDPYLSRQIPLSDLKHWELAPSNPAFLQANKVNFALTSTGLKKADDFWSNLHKALSKGWTVEDALRSLTLTPAKILGVEKEYGSLETGKFASFSVFDQDPFQYKTKLMETWVLGERIVKQDAPLFDIRGTYNLAVNGTNYELKVKGKLNAPEAQLMRIVPQTDSTGKEKMDTIKVDAFLNLSDNDVVLQYVWKQNKKASSFSLKGVVTPDATTWKGDGLAPEGNWIAWEAKKTAPFKEENKMKKAWELDSNFSAQPLYPNLSFGFSERPKATTVLIEHATVWTNETEGIVNDAWVLVENGKIKSTGSGNYSGALPKDAVRMDAKGKHLTSGIIDEHSHIAISKGVNEGGQAISAEVRIGDVINPDDINIYRQLSGGVTAAQLLHGSANPIGGQSALVKLKWGHLPNDFLIPNAPKFVKFALGENVKQANWGDFNTVRFPQTRMGVEQVFIDGFSRALAYHKAMDEAAKGKGIAPARDIELDALYEIVTGQRRISCHSYVQSEINMLMHVADSFGFKVNTFTHILEGYKVADKMKAHGVGASTFADWWAYKFEVKDAIPYNAALMHSMGVTVALNSDDAEMGRRLNQEAGKVIKYGGVSEEEAWKMVTLNPAKLLQLDSRMGSVKVGKDADLVLWSTNPLSIQAKCLTTIVDGEILFDTQKDMQKRAELDQERARIINAMNGAAQKGEKTNPYIPRKMGAYHCSTLGEEMTTEANEH